MKLIIFGATGTLGRYVVEQALEQGHQVTAFARNPSTLKLENPHLIRIAGDVLEQQVVPMQCKVMMRRSSRLGQE